MNRLAALRRSLAVAATAAALTIATLIPGTAHAGPGADPQSFIADLGTTAIATLAGSDIDAATRQRTFEDLLNTNFDLPRISRFALGRFARGATPEQLSEYQDLFRRFIVQTYTARLGGYSGESLRVTGSRPGNAEGETIVTSEVQAPQGGPPTRVEWTVSGTPEDWRIADVVVGGISMTITQRSEFTSVIQNNGGNVQALIDMLRKRVGT